LSYLPQPITKYIPNEIAKAERRRSKIATRAG